MAALTPKKRSKEERRQWLGTPEGQAWLDGKIEEKNALKAQRRADEPVPERFTRTKFPFPATINGKPYVCELRDGAVHLRTAQANA